MENLSPEAKLDNLKFLARYGLIYNSNRCKVCGAGASLIKQADLLDGYVWRCSECKAQKISSKTVVRAGSFFYNLKKPVSLILLTAATFVGDPTLTLEQIVETLVIERSTLVIYENYFLDIIQLVVTNKAGNIVGGTSIIVDVETTILYTDKYSSSLNNRRFTHCIIFLERGSADYVVVEVTQFDAASLADATARHVRDGTKLSSTEYNSIGGVAAVQTEFDSRHPTKNSKFHDFDSVPVRSTEASNWNRIKTSYEEASIKYPQRASLTLSYVLARTSVKKVNSFLYGITLYDPTDASL